MALEGVLLPLKLRKWLSRDVPALYSQFGEDGSIRAGSHRIKNILLLLKESLQFISTSHIYR
ncbi:hypothetical protein C1149_18990 [Clostridium botulinum]|nr:hypothetical protein C1149_18990 [Clostridium botulinum]